MRASTGTSARDIVCVPRITGLAVLKYLGAPGSVLVDPCERVLYFFVPSGSASSWSIPGVDVRPTDGLPLPPPTRSVPPGAYWLTAATHGPRCIRPLSLLAAIKMTLKSDGPLCPRSARVSGP
jgi:hypothetical protein